MNAPVLMIAGLASGQGKTSVTAALARAARQAGQRVQVFKMGPDFIDPMVLERASGAPVYQIDDRMVGVAESRWRVARAAAHHDLVLIEGAMGLHDGPPSSADLARALDASVVVVVDAGSMAQTFGAVVQGLAGYGAPLRIAGAIANRVASAGHAQLLADSLSPAIPLLAAVPPSAATLPSRHLGLSSEAHAEVDAAIDALATAVAPQLLPQLARLPGWHGRAEAPPAPPLWLAGRRIAVARDSAHRFLYPANLELLQAMGAELAFVAPLADEALPEGTDALWLPGGYPELHAAELAEATRWLASLRAHVAAGRPVWAECGGLMSLAEGLTDLDGRRHAMAGLLPGEVTMQRRLVALGVQQWTLPGDAAPLRGHTFHHSSIDTPLAPLGHARRLDGAEGEAVWARGPLRASYFHAYFPSAPAAVARLFSPEPLA